MKRITGVKPVSGIKPVAAPKVSGYQPLKGYHTKASGTQSATHGSGGYNALNHGGWSQLHMRNKRTY